MTSTLQLITAHGTFRTDYGERNNPPLCLWHRVCDHRFLDHVPYRMGLMEGSMNDKGMERGYAKMNIQG